MKKILLLCSMIMYSAFHVSAQKVYLFQDFNSATTVSGYIGTSPNLFTDIPTVGNTKINIANGKLQVVKIGGTGTNRGGFTKHPIAGGPAKFLRVTQEVTLTNNKEAITNGFQFSVGNISGTAPAAPGAANVHSQFVLSPTNKDGVFTIGLGNMTSQEFTGTQTLIWYINNTGKPVGYNAPDGTTHSLPDDANSLWVKSADGTSVVLAIDREPCLTPTQTLNSYKLANNPNFEATLDIDNIELVEEEIVIIPEIVSVKQIPRVEVPMRTSLTFALPTEVEVTFDNGQKGMATVSWAQDATIKYNGYRAGEYPVSGTIKPPQGTINPLGLDLKSIVVIKPDVKIVNAFSPNGDGRNDTWIIPDLKYFPHVDIQVFDQNGVRVFHTTNPQEGWDGKNRQGKVVSGNYLYIINNITNSLIYKGVLTVIKD